LLFLLAFSFPSRAWERSPAKFAVPRGIRSMVGLPAMNNSPATSNNANPTIESACIAEPPGVGGPLPVGWAPPTVFARGGRCPPYDYDLHRLEPRLGVGRAEQCSPHTVTRPCTGQRRTPPK